MPLNAYRIAKFWLAHLHEYIISASCIAGYTESSHVSRYSAVKPYSILKIVQGIASTNYTSTQYDSH